MTHGLLVTESGEAKRHGECIPLGEDTASKQ